MSFDFRHQVDRFLLAEKPEVQNKIAEDTAQHITQFRGDFSGLRNSLGNLITAMGKFIQVPEGEEPNAILRTKAILFLAKTFRFLPKNLLPTQNVGLFVNYFSSFFAADVRHGIAAATAGLLQIVAMEGFRPVMAGTIISRVCKIGDDFQVQTNETRLSVYGLLKELIQREDVQPALQQQDTTGEFILPLLELTRREMEQKSLIEWFGIQRTLLQKYKFSTDNAEAIFDSFSVYFPISIRQSATPARDALTADDLKDCLRACFSASSQLAHRAFPFLLEKLDQGHVVSVSVRLDILRTIKSCLESYGRPDDSILPFTDKIWNSLKYEVINGDVDEPIHETLSTIQSLSRRLAQPTVRQDEMVDLINFVNVVWLDCKEDVSDPKHTRKTGQLITAVAKGGVRAFCLIATRILAIIKQDLARPTSPQHTKDIVELLNGMLQGRQDLVRDRANWHEFDKTKSPDPAFNIPEKIFHDVYLRLWRENTADEITKEKAAVLREVIQGLALMIRQHVVHHDGTTSRAYSDDCCKQICVVLSFRTTNSFNLDSRRERTKEQRDLDQDAVHALQTAVQVYPKGYAELVAEAMVAVKKRNWGNQASRRSFGDLNALCQKLASIGCEDIPSGSSPLASFATFTGAMLNVLNWMLKNQADFKACENVAMGIESAIRYYRKACANKGLTDNLDSLTFRVEDIIQDVKERIPSFPDIVYRPAESFDPWNIISTKLDDAIRHTFKEFLKLGIYIVYQLYNRATRTIANPGGRAMLGLSREFFPQGEHVNSTRAYLHRISNIANIVLREVTELKRGTTSLCEEIFMCFRLDSISSVPYWSSRSNGETNVLSLGILSGMRPGAVIRTPVQLLSLLTSDLDHIHELPRDVQKTRDKMAYLLANKFKVELAPRGSIASKEEAWVAVVNHVCEALHNEQSMEHMSLEKYSRFIAIIAGGIARRDRLLSIGDSPQVIFEAVSKGGPLGPDMARIMERLVITPDVLSRANHALETRLWKQWVYAALVEPVLKFAHPSKKSKSDKTEKSDNSFVYTVYVLHMVKNLNFELYQDNLEAIIRIVLVGMQKMNNLYDLEAACQIILVILEKQPQAFRDFLFSLVVACEKAYQAASSSGGSDTSWATTPFSATTSRGGPPINETRFFKPGRPIVCRRLSTEILAKLPKNFDEASLRTFADQVRAHIQVVALMDKVQEVRDPARDANVAWSKVS